MRGPGARGSAPRTVAVELPEAERRQFQELIEELRLQLDDLVRRVAVAGALAVLRGEDPQRKARRKGRAPKFTYNGSPGKQETHLVADEVRTRRIVLENEAGEAAAVLACGPGGPTLALFNGAGDKVAELTLANGVAALTVAGESGRLRVVVDDGAVTVHEEHVHRVRAEG